MDFTKPKILLLLLLSFLFAVGIAARTPLAGFFANSTDSTTHSAVKTDDGAPSDIQVVVLALRAEGFEPAEMQLTPGEYLFVVRNRTGLEEINVRMLRGSAEQVLAGKVLARRHDFKQRVKLTPGTYSLSETAHPEWNCRIHVKP